MSDAGEIKVLIIERFFTRDVGSDAYKWPDDMQKSINTEERKIRDQIGHDAKQVIDSCDGSHDTWTIRRKMFFELPGLTPNLRDCPATGGPLENTPPSPPTSSGSAGPGVAR